MGRRREIHKFGQYDLEMTKIMLGIFIKDLPPSRCITITYLFYLSNNEYCIVFLTVNRTCGALYDNAICANEDAFPFVDPSQDITDTDVWQCTCKGDSCNTGSHVTYGLSAVLFTAVTGTWWQSVAGAC